MWDFIAALGLVLAIEGLLFAALPNVAKEALRNAAETPVDRMRLVGIISAIAGVALVWLARSGL
jgi:uncharacterized protein